MKDIGAQLIDGIRINQNGEIILDKSKINPHLIRIRNQSLDRDTFQNLANSKKYQDS